MNREGYWLNAETGEYCRIDEHARWITREGNPDRVGLAPELARRMDGLHWQRDRLRILLTAMQGGLVRVRSHGEFVTFEFTMDFEDVTDAVGDFLDETGIAGPQSVVRMTNLRRRERISGTLTELREKLFAPGGGLDSVSIEPVKLNYSEEKLDRVFTDLGH